MSAGDLSLPTVRQPFELDLSGLMTQMNQLQTMFNGSGGIFGANLAQQAGTQIKQLGDTWNNTTTNIVNNIKTMTAAEMAHQQAMAATKAATDQALQAARAASNSQLTQQKAANQTQLTQQKADLQLIQNTQKAFYDQQLAAQKAYQAQQLANLRTANQAQLNQQRADLRAQQQQQQQAQSGSGSGGFLGGLGRGLTGSSLGSGIAFGAGTIVGRAAVDDVAKAFDGWKSSFVGLNASLEQSSLAFTALTGNADKAHQIIAGLETTAQHSVFGLPQLQAAGQQLLAYGAQAEMVVPLVKAIGTAAAASGGDLQDKFERISYVIAELNSGIPLSARQIRQLGMAGVALQPIADQLGLTVEQLRNAGKTGELTADQFVAAFSKVYGESGKFGDFMQKQTETFNGAMQLIKTNVGLALADAFQPLFVAIRDVAVSIGNFVQSNQFSAWAQKVKEDVQSVVNVLKELGRIAEAILAPLATFLGLSLKAGDNTSAIKEQTSATNALSDAISQGVGTVLSATTGLNAYKAEAAYAQDQIDGLTQKINDNSAALSDNQEKIASITNQYDQMKRPIQEAIDKIAQLTPEEINRKVSELNLEKLRIQVELAKPDTSQIDASIKQLQDHAKDIGKGTLDGFNKAIDELNGKIKALEMESPAALDARITALQGKMARLGLGATDAIDMQIATLKQQMADLNSATSTTMKELQDIINAPALNTNSYNSALATLNEQITASADPGQAMALRSQYGEISRQKQSAIDKDTTARDNAKTQLQQLQEYVDTQKTNDEAHMQQLEAHKGMIDATNKTERDGDQATLLDLEDQRKVWEADHKSRLDKLKLELDSQQLGKKQQEDINAADKAANDEAIEKLTHEKELKLASYNSSMLMITAQDRINKLLDAAASTQRQLDELPWKQKLDVITQAEKDALLPLQDQQRALQASNHELEVQKRNWQMVKTEADEAAKAATKAVPPTPKPIDQGGPVNIGERSASLIGSVSNLPKSPLQIQMESLQSWLSSNGPGIVTSFQNIFTEVASAIRVATMAIVDIARLMIDFNNGDWKAVAVDLQRIGTQVTAGTSQGAGGHGPGTAGYGAGIMPGGVSPYDAPPTGTGLAAAQRNNPGAQALMMNIPPFLGGGIFTDPIAGFYAPLIRALGGPNITKLIDDTVKGVFDHIRQAFSDQAKASSAPGATSAGGDIFSWIGTQGDKVRSFFQNLSSDSKTSSTDLNTFGQTSATVLGPDGSLIGNIGKVVTAVTGLFGDNGTWSQSMKESGTSTQQTFGPSQVVEGYITQFTGFLQDKFGVTGVVNTILQDLLHLVFSPIFVVGGGIDLILKGFHTAVIDPIFNIGGALDKLFSSGGTVGTILTSLSNLFGDLFDPGKTLEQKFNSFTGFLKTVFETTIPGFVSSMQTMLDTAFNAALTPINNFMSGLVGAIQMVQDWFGIKKIPAWSNIAMGSSGSVKAADGLVNHAGGPVVYGEAGRELVHQPSKGWSMASQPTLGYLEQGATVLPNAVTESLLRGGVPGFAGGLIGDVAQGALSLLGDAKDKGLSWLTDKAAGAIPDLALPGILGEVGTAVAKEAKEGIVNFVKNLFGRSEVAGRAHAMGFATPRGDAGNLIPFYKAIEDAAGATNMMDWLIGAIIMHETGGTVGLVNPTSGASGLMQVLPSHGYDLGRLRGTSLADAAYQIMSGAQVLQEHIRIEHGNVQAGLQDYAGGSAYPGSFYDELVSGYQSAVEAALHAALVGAVSGDLGGQFGLPVNGPVLQGSMGSYSHGGRVPGFYALDFGVARGTPIHSIAEAVVSWMGFNGRSGQTGPTTVLDHADGWQSLYGHLSQQMGKVGDALANGQVFALSGDPGIDGGYGSGAHLHFELWHNGTRVKAEPYLGISDNQMYEGGYITEPVWGIGRYSKQSYSLGERGIEQVIPAGSRPQGGGGSNVSVNFAPGSFSVDTVGNVTPIRPPTVIIDGLTSKGTYGGRL